PMMSRILEVPPARTPCRASSRCRPRAFFARRGRPLAFQWKTNEGFRHEDYSAAVVRDCFRNAIEEHPASNNYGFTADDVAALIEGTGGEKQGIFWRDIISGQMDADRMDYLLRDSHHIGVAYGKFDLHRLVSSMQALPSRSGESSRLGIAEGGW